MQGYINEIKEKLDGVNSSLKEFGDNDIDKMEAIATNYEDVQKIKDNLLSVISGLADIYELLSTKTEQSEVKTNG